MAPQGWRSVGTRTHPRDELSPCYPLFQDDEKRRLLGEPHLALSIRADPPPPVGRAGDHILLQTRRDARLPGLGGLPASRDPFRVLGGGVGDGGLLHAAAPFSSAWRVVARRPVFDGRRTSPWANCESRVLRHAIGLGRPHGKI